MYLDHTRHIRTCFFQDSSNVLTTLLCLICDAALDQVALGIGRDLARDVDVGSRNDGLRLPPPAMSAHMPQHYAEVDDFGGIEGYSSVYAGREKDMSLDCRREGTEWTRRT
jgi:hypothetical protein